jgi:hypothetical protein
MVSAEEMLSFLKDEWSQYTAGLKRLADDHPESPETAALVTLCVSCAAQVVLVVEWLAKGGNTPPLEKRSSKEHQRSVLYLPLTDKSPACASARLSALAPQSGVHKETAPRWYALSGRWRRKSSRPLPFSWPRQLVSHSTRRDSNSSNLSSILANNHALSRHRVGCPLWTHCLSCRWFSRAAVRDGTIPVASRAPRAYLDPHLCHLREGKIACG